jgi:hypothetical protein
MTRRERIEVLLEYLIDVREGLPEKEPVRGDEMLALMCEAWNSPAYQELENLLPRLKSMEPRPYWHLAERFLRYGERVVAYCPKCRHMRIPNWEKNHDGTTYLGSHSHPPGSSVKLVPMVVRGYSPGIKDQHVNDAIDWLERNYRGEAALPKAVLIVESERRLRVA